MTAVPSSGEIDEVSLRKAVWLVAGMGALHALLFLLSYGLLTSVPGAHAPDEEIVAFYQSGDRRRLILVGLYVMPFAGIAFLWFCMALRVWIRVGSSRANELLAGMQLASGILYVALFFAAAAASSVMAVSIEFSRSPVDPMVARQFPQFGGALLLVFAMRMAAMFVFTTSRLGRMSGALPVWFARFGLVIGLFLLLSASFNRALVLVFPLWLLAACVLLLVRRWRPPAEGALIR